MKSYRTTDGNAVRTKGWLPLLRELYQLDELPGRYRLIRIEVKHEYWFKMI